MAKFIYQMVVTGAQIVGRAFARALKQEMEASQQAAQRRATSAGANKESATQDLKHGINLEEAVKILNIEKQLNKEEIESKFSHLFEVNDRSKGGSFYLQSKVSNQRVNLTHFHTRANPENPLDLAFLLPFSSSNRRYSTKSLASEDVFLEAISDSSMQRALQILSDLDFTPYKLIDTKRAEKLRRASVLLPFCVNHEQKPSILLTLRSSNLISHKWEVCFPGGKESQRDGGDVVETAIRETIEELGVGRESLKIFGALKPLIRQNQNSAVYPVLGYLNHDFTKESLKNFNPSEVEKVLLLPLDKACEADNWSYTRWKSGWITPVYHDDVFNGRQVPQIWGLTSSLVSLILKILLPQHFKGQLPGMKP